MAPCSPAIPVMMRKSGGSLAYMSAFMLAAYAGTVVLMPFLASWLAKGFTADPWTIAKPLRFFIVVPLIIGVAIRVGGAPVVSRRQLEIPVRFECLRHEIERIVIRAVQLTNSFSPRTLTGGPPGGALLRFPRPSVTKRPARGSTSMERIRLRYDEANLWRGCGDTDFDFCLLGGAAGAWPQLR